MTVSKIFHYFRVKTRNRLHQLNGEKHQLNCRRLLVDVSEISRKGGGGGVQRVVRSLYLRLVSNPPVGYKIFPIVCIDGRGYFFCNYKPDDSSFKLDELRAVDWHANDVFFVLDFSPRLLGNNLNILINIKKKGCLFVFLVHDALPLIYPKWFTKKGCKNFKGWLKGVLLLADVLLCVSEDTKTEYKNIFINYFGVLPSDVYLLKIPLGADIDNANVKKAENETHGMVLPAIDHQKVAMIVGTIEPRKGHSELLDAFEALWEAGKEDVLIIVGRVGWGVSKLVQRLNGHVELNKRLHWFCDCSDADLVRLYKLVDGVIVASKGEGFGLPLYEALNYGRPVLARNIPVFREVINSNVTFSNMATVESFAGDLCCWFENSCRNTNDEVREKVNAWDDSSQFLNGFFEAIC